MGGQNRGAGAAGGGVEDPDTLIVWECNRCRPRMGPGNFRLTYTKRHENIHKEEDAKKQEARDKEARQREKAVPDAAKRHRSRKERRKKYH